FSPKMQIAPKSYGEIAKRASIPMACAALRPHFLWRAGFGRNVTRASFLIRGCCRKRGGRGTLPGITICQNRGDTLHTRAPDLPRPGLLSFWPAATLEPRMTDAAVLSRRTVDFSADAHSCDRRRGPKPSGE